MNQTVAILLGCGLGVILGAALVSAVVGMDYVISDMKRLWRKWKKL